jgi:hypothetical protein
VVNGRIIDARSENTMTLVGPKLIVFGGIAWPWVAGRMKYLNDIWALDLNYSTLSHTSLSHFDQIFQQ